MDIQEFIKPEPVVIRADNVSHYALEHGLEQGWDDLLSFKCSRPSFPKMLVQFPAPHWNTTVEVLITEMPKELKFEAKDEAKPEVIAHMNGFRDALLSHGLDRFLMFQMNPPINKGWITTILGLNEHGSVLSKEDGTAFVRIITPKIAEKKAEDASDFAVTVGLATLNFMNCRNVQVIDNPPSRQVKRHCERTGEPLPVTYKTLIIHPNLRRRKVYAQAGIPADRALHIVRGHFKDYRHGRGLGRNGGHGLWWWSPTVRGTSTERAIVKNYSVDVN